MYTKAEQKLINDLQALGGSGWCGEAFRDSPIWTGMGHYFKSLKQIFGVKEYNHVKELMKQNNISNKGVGCSHKILQRLVDKGVILRIDGLPAAYKLSKSLDKID